MVRLTTLFALLLALATSGAAPCRAQCPGGGNCSGHGACIITSCACNAGYAGTACDRCAPGFYGYPNCQPIPTCQNGGVFNTITGRCDCPPGFSGTLCTICAAGYYGAQCSPCPGGATSPCSLHGTCDQGIGGTGQCSCFSGYNGPACQYSNAVTCNGAGTATYTGSCNCNAHVTGLHCEQCAAGYAGYPACNRCAPGYVNYPACTRCDADFNADGRLDPDDISDYINAYFTIPPQPGSDFNNDGRTNPDDLSDYINAYFNGC